MKRDWDLVRRLMIDLEKLPENGQLDSSDVVEYPEGLVAYHMIMMHEAGLIGGIKTSTQAGQDFIAQSLTWEGHELLDKIRRDSAWEKIKTTGREKGVDLTVEVIKTLGTAWVKSKLGLQGE